MLAELEIPWGMDLEPLEGVLDQAACHLYHGRYGAARATLEAVLVKYPFARRLLDTFPGVGGRGDSSASSPQPYRRKPLR
jgi:hypothetical protein